MLNGFKFQIPVNSHQFYADVTSGNLHRYTYLNFNSGYQDSIYRYPIKNAVRSQRYDHGFIGPGILVFLSLPDVSSDNHALEIIIL